MTYKNDDNVESPVMLPEDLAINAPPELRFLSRQITDQKIPNNRLSKILASPTGSLADVHLDQAGESGTILLLQSVHVNYHLTACELIRQGANSWIKDGAWIRSFAQMGYLASVNSILSMTAFSKSFLPLYQSDYAHQLIEVGTWSPISKIFHQTAKDREFVRPPHVGQFSEKWFGLAEESLIGAVHFWSTNAGPVKKLMGDLRTMWALRPLDAGSSWSSVMTRCFYDLVGQWDKKYFRFSIDSTETHHRFEVLQFLLDEGACPRQYRCLNDEQIILFDQLNRVLDGSNVLCDRIHGLKNQSQDDDNRVRAVPPVSIHRARALPPASSSKWEVDIEDFPNIVRKLTARLKDVLVNDISSDVSGLSIPVGRHSNLKISVKTGLPIGICIDPHAPVASSIAISVRKALPDALDHLPPLDWIKEIGQSSNQRGWLDLISERPAPSDVGFRLRILKALVAGKDVRQKWKNTDLELQDIDHLTRFVSRCACLFLDEMCSDFVNDSMRKVLFSKDFT